jgi:acyl-CoA thioester hydrolase
MTTTTIEYGHLEPVDIHFDDLDPMGFVHNSRYAVLVERAISLYWTRLGFGYDASTASTDSLMAVAEFTINYRAPIRQTGPAGVHFWIDRLGTTSAVYRYRVVSPDGGIIHAEGKRVMIKLDAATGRPGPWSDGTREVALGLMRSPAEEAA